VQSHPKFDSVARLAPLLFSRALQKGDTKAPAAMELGVAVSKGIIANQTLAYFIGRAYLFMVGFKVFLFRS
jgi:glycyl-tRNA synthetase